MRILAASTLCVALLLPTVVAAQTESETIDRTVRIGESGRLSLRNFSGDVRVTGVSGGDVVIHAVRRAPRERLERIKLEIVESGSSVSIEANRKASESSDDRNNVVETTFDIKVPFATRLDLKAFSSKLTVEGVTGDIDAETFSGRIEIDLTTAQNVPALNVETFSGDIEARVPESTSGRVRFNSFSGNVRSDVPITMSTRRHRRGDVDGDLGNGGGPTLRFQTFSGDLRIRR